MGIIFRVFLSHVNLDSDVVMLIFIPITVLTAHTILAFLSSLHSQSLLISGAETLQAKSHMLVELKLVRLYILVSGGGGETLLAVGADGDAADG